MVGETRTREEKGAQNVQFDKTTTTAVQHGTGAIRRFAGATLPYFNSIEFWREFVRPGEEGNQRTPIRRFSGKVIKTHKRARPARNGNYYYHKKNEAWRAWTEHRVPEW